MPMIDADGCLLNVSVEGRDGGPTLMLSNSLGATMQMWEPQMKALTQVFRVIRYDRRGHGKSSVPPGPYSLERFGRDVLAILDDLVKTRNMGLIFISHDLNLVRTFCDRALVMYAGQVLETVRNRPVTDTAKRPARARKSLLRSTARAPASWRRRRRKMKTPASTSTPITA